jgi:alginate O-acetyltransferase complex protein AlgJ
MTPRRAEHLAVVAVFLALVLAPGVGLVLGIDRATVSEAEMRELSRAPAWSWTFSDAARWPAAFQRYFEDHFGFRARLLNWRADLLWRRLGSSASDTVIAGKNGWLFYADDGAVEDYLQTEPFTEPELEAWRLTLDRARGWLGARGIRHLVVLAPDKHVVYPEHMPDTLRRMRSDYRVDQLLEHMRSRSTVDILDLRPALARAKTEELLYHRYDTHWNDRGGLAGYQEIARHLGRWFPELEPLKRRDFEERAGVPSGDRTTMLGLIDPGKGAMPGLVRRGGWRHRVVEPAASDPFGEDGWLATEIADPGLPRAVTFRDSFAGRLIPYLSEHFSRAVYVWQHDFDAAVVERERPDVVIQEFVGRHLLTYVPYPDLIPIN